MVLLPFWCESTPTVFTGRDRSTQLYIYIYIFPRPTRIQRTILLPRRRSFLLGEFWFFFSSFLKEEENGENVEEEFLYSKKAINKIYIYIFRSEKSMGILQIWKFFPSLRREKYSVRILYCCSLLYLEIRFSIRFDFIDPSEGGIFKKFSLDRLREIFLKFLCDE